MARHASAETHVRLALGGAAASGAAALAKAARGSCYVPHPSVDLSLLRIQLAAAALLGFAILSETLRHQSLPSGPSRTDELVILAILGALGIAAAALLVSLRFGPCP